MKRWVLIVTVAVALAAAVPDAWAHRGGRAPGVRHHHHPYHARAVTGIAFSYGFAPAYYYWPGWYWYYWPIYGVPPPWMLRPAYAPALVEYQYFCPDSKAYYPDVLECPSEWLAVVPRVANPPARPD